MLTAASGMDPDVGAIEEQPAPDEGVWVAYLSLKLTNAEKQCLEAIQARSCGRAVAPAWISRPDEFDDHLVSSLTQLQLVSVGGNQVTELGGEWLAHCHPVVELDQAASANLLERLANSL
jgi:hypothetical protein